MYIAIFYVILFVLIIQGTLYIYYVTVIHRPSWTGLIGFGLLPLIIVAFVEFLVFVTDADILVTSKESVFFGQINTIRNIKTLNIIASNCTEFNLETITCMVSGYNHTYKNDVDFTVQCFADPNITSYNGTLTVESEYTESEIGFLLVFCLNFCLHAIFSYCFLHCVFLFVQKIFKRIFKIPVLFLNGVAICSHINLSFFIASCVYLLVNKY